LLRPPKSSGTTISAADYLAAAGNESLCLAAAKAYQKGTDPFSGTAS
jgi:hypothetical protein